VSAVGGGGRVGGCAVLERIRISSSDVNGPMLVPMQTFGSALVTEYIYILTVFGSFLR
jgi:hypothetical protein